MHDSGQRHWEAVKWILWYIKGTIDVGLVFEKDSMGKQECVFTLSQVPVSWRSILQSTVALSTTEAEYMAMMEAIKEAIWLQRLLDDLGIDQYLLKINCDSMSALYLTKNQVYHARMMHIYVRFHFIQEILDEGDIEL